MIFLELLGEFCVAGRFGNTNFDSFNYCIVSLLLLNWPEDNQRSCVTYTVYRAPLPKIYKIKKIDQTMTVLLSN